MVCTVMTGQHTTSVTLKQKQPHTHYCQRVNTTMYVCICVCMYVCTCVCLYIYKCHFSWDIVMCRQIGSSPISQMCDILIKTWWGVAFGLCEVRMENIPLQASHVQILFNRTLTSSFSVFTRWNLYFFGGFFHKIFNLSLQWLKEGRGDPSNPVVHNSQPPTYIHMHTARQQYQLKGLMFCTESYKAASVCSSTGLKWT